MFVNYTEFIDQTLVLDTNKIDLMVCHAGFGHVQEALYHGIPMVTIPFQFDQHLNSEKVVRIGATVQLNVSNFRIEELMDTMLHILNEDISYKQQANAWSILMKNYPSDALMKNNIEAIVNGISPLFQLPNRNKSLKYSKTSKCNFQDSDECAAANEA